MAPVRAATASARTSARRPSRVRASASTTTIAAAAAKTAAARYGASPIRLRTVSADCIERQYEVGANRLAAAMPTSVNRKSDRPRPRYRMLPR